MKVVASGGRRDVDRIEYLQLTLLEWNGMVIVEGYEMMSGGDVAEILGEYVDHQCRNLSHWTRNT